MKKLILSTCAVTATMLSLNSRAATLSEETKPFIPKGNFYLQAESGYAGGQLPLTLRGGYEKNFAPHWSWGLEGGYLQTGKNSYDLKGADLLGVLTYKADNGVSVFSKAGLAVMHQKNQWSTASASNNDLSPELGLGLGYDLTERVTVTTSLNRILNTGQTNLLAGLKFKLG